MIYAEEGLAVCWDECYGVAKPQDTRQLVAYCNSIHCFKTRLNRKGTTSAYGTIKDVSIHKDYCPDCSSALLWVKERKKQSRTGLTVADKKTKYTS